jgi:uncharacterized membrane protein
MLTMIEPFLIVGIAVACTVWYMSHKWHRWRAKRPANGLELLARRYARGEINRDDYLQKKEDILGD